MTCVEQYLNDLERENDLAGIEWSNFSTQYPGNWESLSEEAKTKVEELSERRGNRLIRMMKKHRLKVIGSGQLEWDIPQILKKLRKR